MSDDPKEGWVYPVADYAEIMDCGASVALRWTEEDGTIRIRSFKLKDIVALAETAE